MAKSKYRIKDTGSSKMIVLPIELAVLIGIVDLSGNLIHDCVRYEVGQDDKGNYGIIRPAHVE